MWLVTEPNGVYVTDCEEIVLKQMARVVDGLTYTQIAYVASSPIRKKLHEARDRILKEVDLDTDFPDRRARKYPKDPAMAQAIKELEAELE